jgi:hypothetical protein
LKHKTALILAFLVWTSSAFAMISGGFAASSLAKPTVNLPVGWSLYAETAYPNGFGVHDPQGGGYLEYRNASSYVLIYYEDSGGTTYTNAELKSEAEHLYTRGLNASFSDSGNTNVAGVTAGYVKTYNSTNNTYFLLLIFLEKNYYIDAFAAYSPTEETQVKSIMNSISVSGQTSSGGLEGWLLYVIITIVAVVIVIIVAGLLVKRGKK